jgi:tetratricopeptide (TPR) repeat protein
VHAASEEVLMTSFRGLAELLPDGAAKEETDQRKLVRAITRWLEQCQDPWLLIVDNADDLSLVQQYLPGQGNGSVLLTTRANAVGSLAEPLDVEAMGVMEGTHFLLHRTHRQDASEEESNEATNVVIALDGFPLALDQAGAYIEETGCSFGDYLQLYHTHRQTLLARRGRQATNYPDSVAMTWSLSFQQIEHKSPAAAELLRLCALLAPDHIPEELLREGAPYWPPLLQQAAADLLTFNQMIEQLLAFSLVKRLTADQTLSMHRLVQAVQLERMEAGEQRQWAERMVCAVNAVFPAQPEEVSSWPQCLRYLEQVQACDTLIQKENLVLVEAADLLSRSGAYLREHASYALAQALSQRALSIREQQLGPHHPLTASSLNDLGRLYWRQGKYEQAESLFVRALSIREQQLGPHHLETAKLLHNLGFLYGDQGKYEQAESLFVRALSIREQQLGPHHSQTAFSLNNLGVLYRRQGKYEQAEPLLARSLSICEQQLGPHHLETAGGLNNLGCLYFEQGKYEQAEPLFARTLSICEQQLGPHHPETASSLSNLGCLYFEQGKYEQAEPLCVQALSICEQQLGPHHPLTAEGLFKLGLLYCEQGQSEQAEPLLVRALSIQEHTLSAQHPDLASTLSGLARLSEAQGHLQKAAALYQQVLTIREQVYGPHHRKTIQTQESLSRVLQHISRMEKEGE